jgi:hypothetical protein
MVMREKDRSLDEVKDLVSSKWNHDHIDEEISHLDRMVDFPFHKGHTSGPWTSLYLMEGTTRTVNMAREK